MASRSTLAAGILLERDSELAVLSDAVAGGSGLVLVEGPAGIGKSRLLAEAAGGATRGGADVLRAQAHELERESPFGVAIELFAGRLASIGPAERDGLFAGQAALARPLFEPGRTAPADPAALVRGLYWLTVNLAGRTSPLVLVVDDAQWADRPSMAFIAHLAMRLDGLPVTVIASVRAGERATPDDALRSLRETPGVVLVAPAALSEAAVGTIVEEELGEAAPEFVAACTRVSGGNPFMTRELARALRADGVAPTSASVDQVEQLVPTAVLHSLLARLGRLGEAPQRIAGAVAVLGDRALLRHASVLSELDGRDAEEAADALASAGILASGEPLHFTHPLIATAVRSDLAPFASARAHRAAAGLLAADAAPVQEIAAHLALSRPEADPWTLTTLRDAARQAVMQGDPQAAAGLLERALAEPPPAEARPDVLLDLAQAEALAGRTAAQARVAEALELFDEPAGRRRALHALSRIELAAGDHVRAAAALREILDATDPAGPEAQQLLAEYLTLTRFSAPMRAEVEERLEPVVDAARGGAPPSNPGLLAHLVLHMAFRGEPPELIRTLSERAVAQDPLGDAASYGMFAGLIVQALCTVDELDAAERIAGAALAAAGERASLIAAATCGYHRAIPRFHRGALADALADLELAQTASREGWSAGVAWAHALEVHTRLERGELEAARAALARCTPPAETMDGGIVVFARAGLALAERDAATALADAVTAGGRLADGFGIDHPGFVPWRRTAALAAQALGDADRALELAGEQLELARSLGVPRAVGIALRTSAALHGDDRQVELLDEAVGVLAASPSRLEYAHALTELGAAHRRAGRRADAQGPLREGLQLADEMGAVPLAETARTELRATGARPRRAAFAGVDSLTPAERRVAQLAAQGLTNAQIAQDLFVTTKTVQTHLAHTYRKLDIGSRSGLAAKLG